jgi:hypothetical protein
MRLVHSAKLIDLLISIAVIGIFFLGRNRAEISWLHEFSISQTECRANPTLVVGVRRAPEYRGTCFRIRAAYGVLFEHP